LRGLIRICHSPEYDADLHRSFPLRFRHLPLQGAAKDVQVVLPLPSFKSFDHPAPRDSLKSSIATGIRAVALRSSSSLFSVLNSDSWILTSHPLHLTPCALRPFSFPATTFGPLMHALCHGPRTTDGPSGPAVPCPLSPVLCPLPSALCPLPSVLCPLSSALCPLPSVLCPLPSALCPLSSALCPLPSVLCPLSSVLCPLSSVLCPLICCLQPQASDLQPIAAPAVSGSSQLAAISGQLLPCALRLTPCAPFLCLKPQPSNLHRPKAPTPSAPSGSS
jgi:hypothetical protein